MQFATTRFGVLEINEAEIIHFQGGLFGFTNFTKYIIVPHGQGPFVWLQSVEKADLAFPLLDPHLVYPDYLLEVSRADAEELGIVDVDEVDIYVIVAAKYGRGDLQLNMHGPLIVNRKNHEARQVVDPQCRYSGEIELSPGTAGGRQNGLPG